MLSRYRDGEAAISTHYEYIWIWFVKCHSLSLCHFLVCPQLSPGDMYMSFLAADPAKLFQEFNEYFFYLIWYATKPVKLLLKKRENDSWIVELNGSNNRRKVAAAIVEQSLNSSKLYSTLERSWKCREEIKTMPCPPLNSQRWMMAPGFWIYVSLTMF